MKRAFNLQKNLIVFGIPLLLVGFMILITKTSIFKTNPDDLAIAITVDLLLTVPFMYFLLIRKTKIPKTTVMPFLILGVIVCSFILPIEHQQYLDLFKTWILPIVELSIVSYVLYRLRKGVKAFRQNNGVSIDFFTSLKKTCSEILPKSVVMPVATEIAVFYYGFIYWKKKTLKENEFSYHKNSGTITLLVALIFIIAIETVTLHVLLAKWSSIAAWILTFLSIYSGVQLLGFLKSMGKRPLLIENDRLYLRYGIMTETTIELQDIEAIEISSADITLDKETRKLSVLGDLESHNIIIRLKEENQLIGLYGITKTYRNLVLYVDNKIEFKNRIDTALRQSVL